MPFTLPNTAQSIFNPATQPWKTDSQPLDWLLNQLFSRDPQSSIQGIMGAGIGMPKMAAKELDPLAKLVMDTAKGGESLSRNALMPTLRTKAGELVAAGEPGAYHGDLWGQMAYSNPQLFMKAQDNPTMIEHAFQSSTGAHVPYDVAGLLTGPFEPIKRVAEMLKKGTSLDTIMSILSPSGPVL